MLERLEETGLQASGLPTFLMCFEIPGVFSESIKRGFDYYLRLVFVAFVALTHVKQCTQ